MKNFIEAGSFDYLKPVGFTRTGRMCNHPKEGVYAKSNLQALFLIAFKDHTKKVLLPSYKVFFFFIWILLHISASNAQKDLSYALHANIIYRFTKYIDWPNDNNSRDFVIGIVGDTPLYDELEDFVVNKTVGNRKIIIKKLSASADSYSCNILFISEDKGKSLKKIAEITKGSPILIVSETNASALKGACINFVVVNEHLKLEINKSNIEERNLNIASELLSLGTIVK